MFVAVYEAGAYRRNSDQARLIGWGGKFQLARLRSAPAAACCLLALGCEPKLIVGRWSDAGTSGAGVSGAGASGAGASGVGAGGAGTSGAGGSEAGASGAGATDCAAEAAAASASAQRARDPLALPWSTGFENGFCDYVAAGGYCYANRRANFEIVTSPVHSGSASAAFNIVVENAVDGQTRCVDQGRLPDAAYYSAFFFIPSAPTATKNWNLVHFRGGGATGVLHGLWDVSLDLDADGALHLYVFDFLRGLTRPTIAVPAVPLGSWFQIEVYLKRAADATGEFAVYQDGELALQLTELATDDSSYGQWYVGNLADALTPAESTLYVDDVAVREAP